MAILSEGNSFCRDIEICIYIVLIGMVSGVEKSISTEF